MLKTRYQSPASGSLYMYLYMYNKMGRTCLYITSGYVSSAVPLQLSRLRRSLFTLYTAAAAVVAMTPVLL